MVEELRGRGGDERGCWECGVEEDQRWRDEGSRK